MQVRLRLQRFGSKKRPFYRIVAAGIENRRDGKFLDIVGLYHPQAKANQEPYRIHKEKVLYWLSQGAKPTETVRSLLTKVGIWKEFCEEKEKKKALKKQQEKAKTEKAAS